MLIGEYEQKIAAKNRILLPKALREEVGDELIISKGFEQCLIILTPVQWQELIESVVSGPYVSGQMRDTRRFLYASASKLTLDAQGRFIIPKFLKAYSNLEKESIFLGLGSWIELWDKDLWLRNSTKLSSDSKNIANDLLENLYRDKN